MKRIVTFALCLVMALSLSVTALADGNKETVVRVGWYDSPYNTRDASGRLSGYAYEYQIKLAGYTGWTYKYVHGSWPELMEMLKSGDIDLMSDVSYTEEREEQMLFPSLPMGAEEYYVFISPRNQDIRSGDSAGLNGKRIGVNKGSVQEDFFKEWARRNDVRAEVVELTCPEEESLTMMETGKIDAYVTVDSFTDPQRAVPVVKVGSSDFFFAVSKQRPDLLAQLNTAMSKLQDENRYYNQQMFEKYLRGSGANVLLTAGETAWLADHGPIRVGYQDNYLAFCATDPETGELTGVLKDYLALAAGRMANGGTAFEPVAYPTAAAAVEAMKRGEVDCVFPANLSPCDGEALGVVMTQPLMDTEIYAVIRHTDQKVFAAKEHVVVAVNEGNPNYDAFLEEHFPQWRKIYYPTTAECLKAVSDGVADCVLISNYRYNNIARLCEKYRLTTFTTGVEMDYCLAVARGQTELYGILSKTVGLVPASTVNAALSYYVTEDARITLDDFVEDHLTLLMIIVIAVVAVILTLLVQNMRAVRRAKSLISATEIDELTGLYNRGFFFQYATRMRREKPDAAMDAIVLNIDRFHAVNALHGREFGDQTLRVLGAEIRAVANELGGIAGRFEADRFDIFCRHTDSYTAIFDRLQARLDDLSPNTSIRLRMGVMPAQSDLEPEQQFDRARTACVMAKDSYKAHLVVFDEGVRRREIYEQRLLNDLRHALDNYEFEVYYQPKYDIQSEPPRMVSAEALVRWRHPELGMISPDDFIPLFERSGRIGMVDQFVWAEAARQIVRWREQYGVTVPVSVNLSRVDVFDPALEDTLEGILLRNGLDHRALKLEVTESAYTENADQVIRVVESLRSKGYEVEMDDFGTGYSSLNMLSAMPIDVLKMDRAFIRNIEHDNKDIQLVALILEIAKNLKIPVVAEGVETEEQMRLLKDLGCALVQGYYFSKPLHARDFEQNFIRTMQDGQ